MTDPGDDLLDLEIALEKRFLKISRLQVTRSGSGGAVDLVDRQMKFRLAVGPGLGGAEPAHLGAAVTGPTGDALPGLHGLSRPSGIPLSAIGLGQRADMLQWIATTFDALFEQWNSRRKGLLEAEARREALHVAEENARRARGAAALVSQPAER